MTERPEAAVARSPDIFALGPSALYWRDDALVIKIDERSKQVVTPWRLPVSGTIVVHPEMLGGTAFSLAPGEKHLWQCIAPRARIAVNMEAPDLRWSGSAYLDHNEGIEALEDGFADWQWSRAHIGDEVAVIYEGLRRDGSPFASALRFAPDGTPQDAELPKAAPLPPTWWTMGRRTRSDTGLAYVRKTWEDSPFYARSQLSAKLFGHQAVAVHESLSLSRFRSPVVQWMLPYRMPRGRG